MNRSPFPSRARALLRSSSAAAIALTLLASCGGGGDGNAGSSSSGLPPSSSLAEQCAVPRAGSSDTLGSLATEKAYLRSWIDETYLWYQDVRALPAATLDPSGYATAIDYFDALKTPLNDAAGQPKDKFHFTYDTTAWQKLSQQGVQYGYGFEVALLAASPPRSAIVAYLDAASGTPANTNAIARGATIVTVDGVDFANGSDVDALNAGLFPTAAGTHTLVIRDEGASSNRTVTMTAQPITENPVQNVMTLPVPFQKVGYLLFNDHIATAESALVAAFTQLRNAGVTDLVLDIRYNGGGFLDIASEVAYMVAGPNLTTSATPTPFFEREMYNDRNPFNLSVSQADDAVPRPRRELHGRNGPGPAVPRPEPRLRADDRRHLLGKRVHRQRIARRGRHREPGGRHDLRQAVRLLPAGQLRHDLLRDPVPGRQQHELRQLPGRLHADLQRRRRLRPRARQHVGSAAQHGPGLARQRHLHARDRHQHRAHLVGRQRQARRTRARAQPLPREPHPSHPVSHSACGARAKRASGARAPRAS